MPNKNIIIGFLIACVLGGGFVVGQMIKTDKQVIDHPTIQSPYDALKASLQKEEQSPSVEITGSTYIISPPNTGALMKAHVVSFDTIEKNKSTVLVDGEKSQDLEKSQNVLLYDSQKKLIERAIGKITEIEKDNNQTKITVTFYSADPSVFSTISSGHIALKPESVPRLPLTALVMDKDNNPFAWHVQTTSQTTGTAHIKPVIILHKEETSFVIEQEFGANQIYILNPDKKLKDGATITTSKILYNAPPSKDDKSILRQVKKDINAKNDKALADYFLLEAGKETPDPTGPNAGGCAAAPEISEPPGDKANEDILVMACTNVEPTPPIPLLDVP